MTGRPALAVAPAPVVEPPAAGPPVADPTVAEPPARIEASARHGLIRRMVKAVRPATTLEQLGTIVPTELCRLGFTRAWLQVLDGERTHLATATGAKVTVSSLPAGAQPAEGSPDAEAIRRRRAILGAGSDGSAAAAAAPRAIAPIVLETRVLALIGADRVRVGHRSRERPVERRDLEELETIAELLGETFHRILLQQRLDGVRAEALTAARSLADAIDQRCEAGLTTVLGPAGRTRPASESLRAASYSGDGAARLHGLLTPREIEVLRLMATGYTNDGIARELIVSPGTVKSHVKSVLRKLHANNRGQAIARYYKIAGVAPDPG